MSLVGFGLGCSCGAGTGGVAAFEAEINVLCDTTQYCGGFTDRTPDGIGVDAILTINGSIFPLGTMSGASPAALAADLTANDPFGGTWTISGASICVTPGGNDEYTEIRLDWLTPAVSDTIALSPANVVPFLSVCTVDTTTGAVTGCSDFELDGVTPYVRVGPVAPCGEAGAFAAQVEVLCDDNGAFQRVKIVDTNSGAIQGVADFDLTSSPYTATGAVHACDDTRYQHQILCDDVGTFLRHYVADSIGGVFNFIDTTLDGSTPYAPTGTVRDCQNDVEIEILCDRTQYCGNFVDRTPDVLGVDVILVVNGSTFPLGTMTATTTGALVTDLDVNDPFSGTWSIVGNEICVTPNPGDVYESIRFDWLTSGNSDLSILNGGTRVPFELIKVVDGSTNPPTIISTGTFDLDSNPYAVQGNIELCSSDQNQVVFVERCVLDTVTNLVRTVETLAIVNVGGQVVSSVVDLLSDFVTLAPPLGVNEVYVNCDELFVEVQCYVDIQADGTRIPYVLQRVGYATDSGSAAIITALTPNLTGAYVITGVRQIPCESDEISTITNPDGIQVSGATETTVTNGGNIPDIVRTVTVCVTNDGGGTVDITLPTSGNVIQLNTGNCRTLGNGDTAGVTRLEGAFSFAVTVPAGGRADIIWEVPT